MRNSALVILIACMVQFVAAPNLAGQSAPWPTQYIPTAITTVDAQLEVGYYIRLLDTDAIKVQSDIRSGDPYHTFKGCKNTTVESNFSAQMQVYAKATSIAKGDWTATITPPMVIPGKRQVQICVVGKNVSAELLTAGGTSVKVAEVTVIVIPL